MQYTQLKAGDVRKQGDEVAQRRFVSNPRRLEPKAYSKLDPFEPSKLIGHSILASDLIHLEFRRPLP